MFSDEIVLEIRRLLDEGQLSWRAIGEQLGVSRGVVGNVAKGRRRMRSPRPLIEKHSKLASRCRKCGGLVYQPCRLCRTRSYQRLMRQIRRQPDRRPPAGPGSRRVA